MKQKILPKKKKKKMKGKEIHKKISINTGGLKQKKTTTSL